MSKKNSGIKPVIIGLWRQGNTSADIAEALGVNISDVKTTIETYKIQIDGNKQQIRGSVPGKGTPQH